MKNNLKLGIIFCAYGIPEYVGQSINSWIKAKEKYDIKIAAVHGQFKEYHENGIEDKDEATLLHLGVLSGEKKIDYLYYQNNYYNNEQKIYQTEAEIRDKGLQYLLDENVDYVMLWDSDEAITDIEIDNLFTYLQDPDNQLYTYHRIEYKNLIWNNKFIRGFNPKRVFKVDFENHKLYKCYNDNDFLYHTKLTNSSIKIYRDEQFSGKQIPINLINPLHFSWNDYERSKKKIDYQRARGWDCSYTYDDKEISFNLEYYKKKGENPPEIFDL